MADFKISVDLSELLNAQAIINRQVFPHLRHAVGLVARAAKTQWIQEVKGAHLWTQEKKAYAQSIRWKFTGEFSAVVWSDYQYADEIETGRPAKDLKKMLQTSTKTRISKKGKKYLIIPFRHQTPGNNAIGQAMPAEIYAKVKSPAEFERSHILDTGYRKSATGHLVARHIYQWGDRLPAGLADKKAEHHKTDIYAGMVAFPTGKKGKNSTSYLTFRVMTEDSPGWIVPAKPGLYLAKAVADRLQPKAEIVMQGAIQKDTGL